MSEFYTTINLLLTYINMIVLGLCKGHSNIMSEVMLHHHVSEKYIYHVSNNDISNILKALMLMIQKRVMGVC